METYGKMILYDDEMADVANCIAPIDHDTVLYASTRGRISTYRIDYDRFKTELFEVVDRIPRQKYCADLVLLPNSHYALATAHNIIVGSYKNSHIPYHHDYDYISCMKNKDNNLLLACLSSKCVLWSTEYECPLI